MVDAYAFFENPKKKDESIEIHLDIVKNISKLLEELKLNTVHEYFYAFCYLLWNGYFSLEKTYKYNNMDIIDEYNTIFLGRGCCRHNANLLYEVLRDLNIFTEQISVRTNNIKLKNIMKLETKVECNNVNKELPASSYNHRIVLARFNANYFILDPTMLTECELIKKGKLICFNGTYKINKHMFIDELSHSLFSQSSYNPKATLNKQMLLNYYSVASKICHENDNVFENFFNENYPNYQKVKELTLSKKTIL